MYKSRPALLSELEDCTVTIVNYNSDMLFNATHTVLYSLQTMLLYVDCLDDYLRLSDAFQILKTFHTNGIFEFGLLTLKIDDSSTHLT